MVLINPRDDSDAKQRNYRQWAVTILANMMLLTYGLHIGWISPMKHILESKDSPIGLMTQNELGMLAATMSVAATLSVWLYSYIADKYGRKIGMVAICGAQAISWIIKLTATNFPSLLLARAFSGFAAAGCFNVVPMYVKEISDDRIRGILGVFFILFQNMGLLIMYALGTYLEYHTVLWAVAWLPIAIIPLLYCAPESPTYLVKVGKIDVAAKNLAYLRCLDITDKWVQSEVISMTNQHLDYISLPKLTTKKILSNKAWRKGIILVFCIATVQALNGSFAIVTYASQVLPSPPHPDWIWLSFPAIMILGAVTSMICVERFGRKPLHVSCLMVSSVSLGSLATLFVLQARGVAIPSWPVVAASMVTLFCYAAGIVPMPYIMMTEIFNFQIRATVMSFFCSYIWLIISIQLGTFSSVSEIFGLDVMFFGFAGINFVGAVFAFFFMIETKGKNTIEIELELYDDRPRTFELNS